MSIIDDELSGIWLRQLVPAAPPEQQILADAVAVKRKVYRKFGLAALSLLATLVFINLIVYSIHTKQVTTVIGIALINLGILFYLAASGDVIILWMKKIGQDLSVKDSLDEMVSLKKRQQFLCGRLLGVYFILLFSGLMLYCWEFARRMSLVYGIGVYVLTIGWVLFAWFYLRPRTIKKHQEPVDAMIREMERVSGQFLVNS
ncbi:MAG TPA: hypothetical protein VK518_08965 [Puia sp.]|nr:hypothetical protein [Puia sp.]